ncbi:MAG: hypothetical protein WA192_13540 [Candidatus Acidiferrales bacterium]
MAKIRFTLHGIAREIRKAEKTLRAIRSKVSKPEQKMIDLELRSLEKDYKLLKERCKGTVPFGHAFITKPK